MSSIEGGGGSGVPWMVDYSGRGADGSSRAGVKAVLAVLIGLSRVGRSISGYAAISDVPSVLRVRGVQALVLPNDCAKLPMVTVHPVTENRILQVRRSLPEASFPEV